MRFTNDLKLKRKAHIYVDTIKNGGTLTEAGVRIWPKQKAEVARVSMSQDLQKPNVQRTILQVMREQGMTDEFLVREHNKVITQDEQLGAKNVALDMAYKLKGAYAPDRNINVNIDIPADEKGINDAILALQKELKEAE